MKKLVIAIILGVSSTAAHAQNIVYTFSGIGSGALGETGFTDTAFTISVYANVEDILSDPPDFDFYVEDIRSVFEISGVGSGEFLNAEQVFVADDILGFSHGVSMGETPGPLELLDLSSEEFVGYDLSSAFGPVTVTGAGTAIFAFEQFQMEPTTSGALTFSNVTTATFTATVIPEPSVALLGMVSVATLALGRRRSAGSGMTR